MCIKRAPQLAVEIRQELQSWQCRIELVLTDSLYGECSDVINVLDRFKLPFIVAIRNKREARCPRLLKFRSHHGVLMPQGQKVRYNRAARIYSSTISSPARNTRLFVK